MRYHKHISRLPKPCLGGIHLKALDEHYEVSINLPRTGYTNVTQVQTQAQGSSWLSTTKAYIVVDNQIETWAWVWAWVTLVQLAPGMMIHLPSNAEATWNRPRKDFWKPPKPCHVGIHWKALAEYSQMGTHVPAFQSFLKSYCIILPPAAYRVILRGMN